MTPPAVTRDRLRVAIQKSGRLSQPARDLLAAIGLTWRESRDKLFCYGESLPVDLLLVRDDDIPGLIADGVCDLGIVGRNVLVEHGLEREAAGASSDLREFRELGWGACRLDIAISEDQDWGGPEDLEGLRIATSYPQTLGKWLKDQQVRADVVTLAGSVEIAPRLGQAEAICDLVQSGGTLVANQLKPVQTLLHSEAVLAGSGTPPEGARGELVELLLRRLDGAMRLKETRLLMLRSAREQMSEVLTKLPDGHEPTIMGIEGSDEVNVQMLCHAAVPWQQLEELKRAGARQIMVLPVEGMLA